MLTIFSAKFAGETLNLLMGVLNDDSMLVQLQALETMCHMAAYDCLKLQETHMHTFLGTLANKSILIRVAVRKILKLVKLLDFGLFKLCINRLLDNLDIYQQDEADIFSVLFHIGQHHGNFVVCLIKEVLQEIEPADEGKLDFDSGRVAALLVLAISVPPSHEQSACGIPPRIYSYAVTLVGRISRSLGDIIDQNSLLCYLSRCSRSTIISNKEFEEEAILPVVKDDGPIYTGTESLSHYGLHSWKISDRASEVQTQILREQSEVATGYVDYQLELHDKVLKSINLILAMVKDIWPLIQSGCASEALRILRGCKEGLTTFSIDAARYANPLAFSLQYVQAIELIIKVLVHFLPTRKFASDMGDLDLQLGKFERRLREMRCRFIGISKEGELHVLELILLTCVLMSSQVQNFCHNSVLKKLSTTVSLIESVHNEGSIEPSDFFVEVKKSLCEITTSVGDAVKRLLNVFSFRQFMLCGRLKFIHAELDVPDNDSENPFTFVPGLPVSIPFKITLHNVSTNNRLWLKLTIGEELTQFVFLEFGQNGGSDRMRELTYVAPFYRTPTAISFTMRVCIGMELSEDVHLAKGRGGPKKEVVYLCQEKEVYFSMGIRN